MNILPLVAPIPAHCSTPTSGRPWEHQDPVWPHSPSLNCTTGCLSWAPGSNLQHASGEGLTFELDVHRFLVGKWLVLIGDSAARMMYHQLAALLSGKWTVWSGDGDMTTSRPARASIASAHGPMFRAPATKKSLSEACD